MCKPISKLGASDGARSVHEALLALYDVLTSGWVNDAPFLIQEFKLAAEDAIYAELAKDYSLGDGVNEILDAAQEWAGHTPIDDRGREIWHKRVSIVERGLFDLVQSRATAFFGTVWRLKLTGSSASSLVPEQQKFKRKLETMEGALKRARRDPEPAFRMLLLTRAVVPAVCATRVVQYIA